MPAQAILHFWFEALTAKQHFVKDTALDETIAFTPWEPGFPGEPRSSL